MPVIPLFLFKLAISLSIVWIFYQLLLRRLTFYRLNRWYLLGYTVLAFIIPLINIGPMLAGGPSGEPTMVQYIPAIGQVSAKTLFPAAQRTVFSGWNGLLLLFLLGVLLLLVRSGVRWFSLVRLRHQARRVEGTPLKIYQVDAPIIPFSFGNAIYINQQLHTEKEWADIILHEYVHIRQRHTVDILLAELVCILNWYNPFSWLIRYSIRQNLEFIADQQVLDNGVDRKGYQYHLLKVVGESRYRLANNFNFSSLKKRIVMMNKIRSARVHLLKLLFLVPLVSVLLLAFRDRYPDLLHRSSGPVYVNAAGIVIALPGKSPLAGVIVRENVLRGPAGGSGGVTVIDRTDTVPVGRRRGDTTRHTVRVFPVSGPVLYVVDGEKMPEDWKSDSIPPSAIQSVDIIKGEQAVRLFGKRGENGVVAITLKSGGHMHRVETDPAKVMGKFQPLFVIDGKEVLPGDTANLGKLNPDQIGSIQVLKDSAALRQYGEKGRNGVVIVTLKKESSMTQPAHPHVTIVWGTKDGQVSGTADTIQAGGVKIYAVPGNQAASPGGN